MERIRVSIEAAGQPEWSPYATTQSFYPLRSLPVSGEVTEEIIEDLGLREVSQTSPSGGVFYGYTSVEGGETSYPHSFCCYAAGDYYEVTFAPRWEGRRVLVRGGENHSPKTRSAPMAAPRRQNTGHHRVRPHQWC